MYFKKRGLHNLINEILSQISSSKDERRISVCEWLKHGRNINYVSESFAVEMQRILGDKLVPFGLFHFSGSNIRSNEENEIIMFSEFLINLPSFNEDRSNQLFHTSDYSASIVRNNELWFKPVDLSKKSNDDEIKFFYEKIWDDPSHTDKYRKTYCTCFSYGVNDHIRDVFGGVDDDSKTIEFNKNKILKAFKSHIESIENEYPMYYGFVRYGASTRKAILINNAMRFCSNNKYNDGVLEASLDMLTYIAAAFIKPTNDQQPIDINSNYKDELEFRICCIDECGSFSEVEIVNIEDCIIDKTK